MSEYGNDKGDREIPQDMNKSIDKGKDEKIVSNELNAKMESSEEVQGSLTDFESFNPNVETNDTIKENFNREYLEEKNQEDVDIHNYNNLFDERIQKTFRTYYNETGKYPNHGKNLRKDFMDWVKKNGSDLELINKIYAIHKNQEIYSFIKDKIENSDFSQTKISTSLREDGLSVSRGTVGNISLNEVYNDNKDAHHQRFDISLDPEIKERIKNRLNQESENYKLGAQHDSLYKIAKNFPEISEKTVHRIAKNEISQDLYRNMWRSTSGSVSNETKKVIEDRLKEEVQKENPSSLRSISNDFPGASHTYVMELAREIYPDRYKDLWPAIKKIPNEIKNEIMNSIKDESLKEHPRTLRNIHKDFPEVGADTIKRLAKQVIPKDLHDKIWAPLTTEIPKELALKITKTIKNEINKPNPRSLNEVGKHFSVSTEYICKLAKKTISKQEYENTWKAYESITKVTKNNIVKDIMNTKLNISEIAEKNSVSSPSVSNISQRDVFQDNIEDHRERFPIDENLEIGSFTHLNINSLITKTINDLPNQKYYAEPNIYPDKRRPDGLILEDNNFIHQRLSNSQTGEDLKNKLELNPKNLDQIKSTQFDFTNDVSDENLIDKIEKYQSEDTLLFIVGTRWYLYDEIKNLPVDDKIKYAENVRIVSNNLGADLIGLEGNDKDLYDKIIEFNYNHDLNSLKMLYNYDLSSINNHNTQELREDLVQKGLIKADLNEYFNFDEVNKKDPEEKQLDLDHFLNF